MRELLGESEGLFVAVEEDDLVIEVLDDAVAVLETELVFDRLNDGLVDIDAVDELLREGEKLELLVADLDVESVALDEAEEVLLLLIDNVGVGPDELSEFEAVPDGDDVSDGDGRVRVIEGLVDSDSSTVALEDGLNVLVPIDGDELRLVEVDIESDGDELLDGDGLLDRVPDDEAVVELLNERLGVKEVVSDDELVAEDERLWERVGEVLDDDDCDADGESVPVGEDDADLVDDTVEVGSTLLDALDDCDAVSVGVPLADIEIVGENDAEYDGDSVGDAEVDAEILVERVSVNDRVGLLEAVSEDEDVIEEDDVAVLENDVDDVGLPDAVGDSDGLLDHDIEPLLDVVLELDLETVALDDVDIVGDVDSDGDLVIEAVDVGSLETLRLDECVMVPRDREGDEEGDEDSDSESVGEGRVRVLLVDVDNEIVGDSDRELDTVFVGVDDKDRVLVFVGEIDDVGEPDAEDVGSALIDVVLLRVLDSDVLGELV